MFLRCILLRTISKSMLASGGLESGETCVSLICVQAGNAHTRRKKCTEICLSVLQKKYLKAPPTQSVTGSVQSESGVSG